jgi:hypothetical protein
MSVTAEQDLAKQLRDEAFGRSSRPVFAERFEERLEAIEHPDKIWRQPPVDIFAFARDFLSRTRLSEFNIDAMRAFAGGAGDVWDESYKIIGLAWGIGGSKNFTSEILCAYQLYRLLLMVDPHRYFGLDPTGSIDILNISFVNERQASEIFFDRLKNTIRSTVNPETGRNWFSEHGVDLRDHGIGDIQAKMITLPRRLRARCLPFTEAAFEGSNILLGILDEPSRVVGSIPDNAKAHNLFAKLLDNTTSRFGRRGKLVAFSYPEAIDGDLIMELFAQAGTQFTVAGRRTRPDGNPDIYASLGATYDTNPRVKRSDFDQQRRTDPEGVACRVDCNPPQSRTGWLRAFPEKIDASFCWPERNAVIAYEVVPITTQIQQDGQLICRTYTGINLVWCSGDDEPRALGGDPGQKCDAFVLALARTEPAKRPIEMTLMRRERTAYQIPYGFGEVAHQHDVERQVQIRTVDRAVVIDGLVEIVPIRYERLDEKTGRMVTDVHPISFLSVRDFILKLKQHFPRLDAAAFDQWQSAEIVEELIRVGIRAESLAFTAREQFSLYAQHRALIYNDMLKCLPSARAIKEFRELQEVRPGKVDHPPAGSKDVADAIVIACNLALELEMHTSGCRVFV